MNARRLSTLKWFRLTLSEKKRNRALYSMHLQKNIQVLISNLTEFDFTSVIDSVGRRCRRHPCHSRLREFAVRCYYCYHLCARTFDVCLRQRDRDRTTVKRESE